MTQLVKKFTYTGGSQTFTMPTGFKPDVQVYMWGAGGGAGSYDSNGNGGAGHAGWYLAKTITINEGDTVEVAVGGAGSGGKADGSRGTGGAGRSGFSYTGLSSYGNGRSFAGGHGGNMGPRGWSGGGGGGGAASVVIVNGSKAYVAAGGGGGAGGSLNVTGSGAMSTNVPSGYTFLSKYSDRIARNDLAYANLTYTWTVYFPQTGTYSITAAADDGATFYVDGVSKFSIGETTASGSFYMTAGNHSLVVNWYSPDGDPSDVKARITAPNGTVVFNTDALPRFSNGANGQNCPGDGGGGGGGGGGITGGQGGSAGYDNSTRASGGYSGTSTPGAVGPIGGVGTTPAGTTSGYWVAPFGQGGASNTLGGSSGLVVLVFTSNSIGHINVDDAWRNVKTTSVKVNGVWRQVQAAYTKVNGVWREIRGSAPTSISVSNTGGFAGPTPELTYTSNTNWPGLAGEQSMS